MFPGVSCRLRHSMCSWLVAICAGSDVMHPIGTLVTGAAAGALFVTMLQVSTNKWRIDDVLVVWALHGFVRPVGRDRLRYFRS